MWSLGGASRFLGGRTWPNSTDLVYISQILVFHLFLRKRPFSCASIPRRFRSGSCARAILSSFLLFPDMGCRSSSRATQISSPAPWGPFSTFFPWRWQPTTPHQCNPCACPAHRSSPGCQPKRRPSLVVFLLMAAVVSWVGDKRVISLHGVC